MRYIRLRGTWIDPIRPLPGGHITRLVLLVTLFAALLEDLKRDDIDFHRTQGIIDFSAPYAPVAGLIVSPALGALLWIASGICLIALAQPALVGAFLIPTVIVLLSTCITFPMRQAVWFFFAVIAVNVIAIAQIQGAWELLLLTIPMYSAVGVGGLLINRQFSTITARESQIEELRERQARVRREERHKLAFELHDIVAHDITIIAMQARRAQFVRDEAKTQEILEGIGHAAQQTLQDLRSLLMLLKTHEEESGSITSDSDTTLMDAPEVSGETTTAIGLVKDINNVVDALRRAGFAVEQSITGEVSRVPASVRQTLKRAVREMGTNVLKHAAPSTNVQLNLVVDDSDVRLAMTNTIGNTAPIMSTQTGMEALRARAEAFGGELHAGAVRDRWTTTLRVSLSGFKQSDLPTDAAITLTAPQRSGDFS